MIAKRVRHEKRAREQELETIQEREERKQTIHERQSKVMTKAVLHLRNKEDQSMREYRSQVEDLAKLGGTYSALSSTRRMEIRHSRTTNIHKSHMSTVSPSPNG